MAAGDRVDRARAGGTALGVFTARPAPDAVLARGAGARPGRGRVRAGRGQDHSDPARHDRMVARAAMKRRGARPTQPPHSPAVRIERIEHELIREVHYLNASSRGTTDVERLPVSRGMLAAPLAGELDALIICSDLQGVVPGPQGRSELLGVQVAAVLEELAADAAIPPAARTGVVLAGDLYSVPAANKRGGY